MWGRLLPAVLLTLVTALASPGCDTPPAPEPSDPTLTPAGGTRFDPKRTATVQGVVRWCGAIPPAPDFRSVPQPLGDPFGQTAADWPNPHAVAVDASGGVGGALVYLVGVDSQAGRAWDLPPVRVELKGQRFEVVQGSRRSRIGILRPGERFEVVSHDRVFHNVQARGAAFFTCPLPEPEQVRTREVKQPGLVELQSGCGYFWMRANLLVTPHPYAVLTDTQGRFVLPNVPAGEYQIAAWTPNPRVLRQERNAENQRVQQVRFAPPLESRKGLQVQSGRTAEVELKLGR